MNVNISINKAIGLLFLFVLIVLASAVAGYRDYSIGLDTYNYISIFLDHETSIWDAKQEVGFIALSKLIYRFGGSVEVFFTTVAFTTTSFMCMAYYKLARIELSENVVLNVSIFFILLFFSDWYFSGLTNGLRHAAALSILYYSLSFFRDRRIISFIFFFVLSVSFHKSVLLIIPFLLFFLLELRVLFLLFFLFSIGYYLDVNSYVIMLLSEATGIGVYDKIYNYLENTDGEQVWRGFNLSFYLYNLFWFLLPFILIRIKIIEGSEELYFIIKAFAVFSIFYFTLGFGAFSNRWAYFSWLFLPILQACLITSFKIDIFVKVIAFPFVFLATFYFMSRFVVW